MTAAIALAVVLVVVVAGMSLAMQGQTAVQSGARSGPIPRRPRERRPPAPPPAPPPPEPEPEAKGPELLRNGTPALAKVVGVVDERVVGPVTRSRLTLAIEPPSGTPFEVTIRFAFPTPAQRARVRAGETVPVRFDPADHRKVVLDLPRD